MNLLIPIQLFNIGLVLGTIYWERKTFKWIHSRIDRQQWSLNELFSWKSQAVGIDKAIDLKNMNDRITSFSDKYSDLFSQLDNCRREIKTLEAEIASVRAL